ncbi:hypothetical protein HDU97_009614 [Phlyctochytrium planicorne]|nr:hypothetical protein HDU97_009614 [Phlyctochytrium planicorne]
MRVPTVQEMLALLGCKNATTGEPLDGHLMGDEKKDAVGNWMYAVMWIVMVVLLVIKIVFAAVVWNKYKNLPTKFITRDFRYRFVSGSTKLFSKSGRSSSVSSDSKPSHLEVPSPRCRTAHPTSSTPLLQSSTHQQQTSIAVDVEKETNITPPAPVHRQPGTAAPPAAPSLPPPPMIRATTLHPPMTTPQPHIVPYSLTTSIKQTSLNRLATLMSSPAPYRKVFGQGPLREDDQRAPLLGVQVQKQIWDGSARAGQIAAFQDIKDQTDIGQHLAIHTYLPLPCWNAKMRFQHILYTFLSAALAKLSASAPVGNPVTGLGELGYYYTFDSLLVYPVQSLPGAFHVMKTDTVNVQARTILSVINWIPETPVIDNVAVKFGSSVASVSLIPAQGSSTLTKLTTIDPAELVVDTVNYNPPIDTQLPDRSHRIKYATYKFTLGDGTVISVSQMAWVTNRGVGPFLLIEVTKLSSTWVSGGLLNVPSSSASKGSFVLPTGALTKDAVAFFKSWAVAPADLLIAPITTFRTCFSNEVTQTFDGMISTPNGQAIGFHYLFQSPTLTVQTREYPCILSNSYYSCHDAVAVKFGNTKLAVGYDGYVATLYGTQNGTDITVITAKNDFATVYTFTTSDGTVITITPLIKYNYSYGLTVIITLNPDTYLNHINSGGLCNTFYQRKIGRLRSSRNVFTLDQNIFGTSWFVQPKDNLILPVVPAFKPYLFDVTADILKLGSAFRIKSSDGRAWSFNADNTIKLNSGTAMSLYYRKEFMWNYQINQPVLTNNQRWVNPLNGVATFETTAYPFLFRFIKHIDGSYLLFEGNPPLAFQKLLGYDANTDQVVRVPFSDPRIVRWTIEKI